MSDSTCLIGLERVGELDILPALFDSVMIPPEVERENYEMMLDYYRKI